MMCVSIILRRVINEYGISGGRRTLKKKKKGKKKWLFVADEAGGGSRLYTDEYAMVTEPRRLPLFPSTSRSPCLPLHHNPTPAPTKKKKKKHEYVSHLVGVRAVAPQAYVVAIPNLPWKWRKKRKRKKKGSHMTSGARLIYGVECCISLSCAGLYLVARHTPHTTGTFVS